MTALRMPASPAPSEKLRRLLRVAKLDGLSIVIVAGGFGLISAACGDWSGAGVGLLIAAAGAFELRGVSLLRGARIAGLRWLVGSQVYLLTMILGYVAFRLANLPRDPLVRLLKQAFALSGFDMEMLPVELPQLVKTVYVAVAAVTILYQGGMILYYLARRRVVAEALREKAAVQVAQA